MGWTKVEVPKPHVCDKPYYVTPEIKTYDVIQCDCGAYWQCVGIDTGMHYDPFPKGVLKWIRCGQP